MKFDIDEDAIKEVNKDGTYTFYGVYKKTDAAAAASSQYRQYPVYVAIPYVVKVQNYPTLAMVELRMLMIIVLLRLGRTDLQFVKVARKQIMVQLCILT